MPYRAPRLCPRCGRLVTSRNCPSCSPAWGARADVTRAGSTRSMPTNSQQWRKLRRAVFAEQRGICAVIGCVELCTELDHVLNIARGGTDERSNLQGLCAPHHREKTQRESRTS